MNVGIVGMGLIGGSMAKAFQKYSDHRVYVYDNSIDDTEARLLFRMTDGKLFKRYTDDIPLWAQTIID